MSRSRVEELVRLAQEAVDNDEDDEGPVFKPSEPKLPPNAKATQVVTCQPKHYAHGNSFRTGLHGTGFTTKRPVSLKQCQYGVNRGVCLCLTVADVRDFRVTWSQTSSLNIIVEDANGWRAILSVHHGSPRFFQEWPAFCVIEPRLKKKKDGSIVIRVDSPLDVHAITPREFDCAVVMKTAYRRRLQTALLLDMEELKEKGIEFHARGDLSRALRCWTQALLVSHGNTAMRKTTAMCRLNRAAVYLKCGRPKLAELDCRIIMMHGMLECLTPLQVEKMWFRRITAQYEAGYSSSKASELRQIERSEERDALIKKWVTREQAADKGDYDWKAMLQAAQKGEPFDFAEFPPSLRHSRDINKSGLVNLVTIPGQGRGLVAARDIEMGELIFLSKPLAFAGPPTTKSGRQDLQTVNLATQSVDTSSRAELIRQFYENAIDNEELVFGVEDLYAGPSYGDNKTVTMRNAEDYTYAIAGLQDSIDPGKVEGAVTYNSFRVRCASKVFETEEESQSPASALYLHASMLNHSCLANCTYTWFGQALAVRAMTKIRKGEELTISYCDPCANLEDRRKALRHHFRPDDLCKCLLCESDALGRYRDRRAGLKACEPIESLGPEAIARLQTTLEDTYGNEKRLDQLRPEMYTVYRQMARLATSLRDRCGYESVAASCLFPPSAVKTQTGYISCSALVLSLLLVGRLMLEAGEEFGMERLTTARGMHDTAAQQHFVLYGPGLLKARLGEWMASEGIRWLGTTSFEDA